LYRGLRGYVRDVRASLNEERNIEVSLRSGNGKFVVLVTCGSAAEAQRIARKLVDERIAACVNVVISPVESIYRWKGKIESAREFLLVIKTDRRKLGALERAVKKAHSYDVPEILALPVSRGSANYLSWMEDCLGK
jgi:periplasmic divalent cation tolerance protein